MMTGATAIVLFLFAMTSSLEGSQLRSCVEEDVCSAIIFNQLTIATMKDDMRELMLSLDNVRNKGEKVPKEGLSGCHTRYKQLKKQIQSLERTTQAQKEVLEEEKRRLEEEIIQKDQQIQDSDLGSADEKEELRLELEDLRRSHEAQRNSLEEANRLLQEVTIQRDELIKNLTIVANKNQGSADEKEEPLLEMEDPRRSHEDQRNSLEEANRRLQEPTVQKDELIKNLTILAQKPVDCAEIQIQGRTESGIYTIYPYQTEESIDVLCDLDSHGGGWTVFFTRQPQDQPLDFNESWENFKNGFGDPNTEYWLGNDLLHALTSHGASTLRLDAEIFSGERRWAEWNVFVIGDEESKYEMTLEEYDVTSTMGDSLSENSNSSFTTFDNDNDERRSMNCALGSPYAKWGKGGWWYKGCGSARLTAPLKNSNSWDSCCYRNWNTEGNSLVSFKTLSMKFQRHNYEERVVRE